MKVLPEISAVAKHEIGGPRRVAILGRPNVGKSSLLNKAAGEERVVVNELAGTTRDPVDEIVELGGKLWRFVDTAGIRRRVHLQQGADFYASLRTSAALEKAEVAVVVIDVSESISEQDVRIIDLVLESGRALVLAFNKWDRLADDDLEGADRRRYLEREIEQDLAHVAWAPARQHLREHRPSPRAARAGARDGARVVGSAHPDGQVQRLPRRARRRAPAPAARRQAARASCSARRRPAVRRHSCCSRPASSTPATAATCSAACASSTASRERRSSSTCGCARSARADRPGHAGPLASAGVRSDVSRARRRACRQPAPRTSASSCSARLAARDAVGQDAEREVPEDEPGRDGFDLLAGKTSITPARSSSTSAIAA